MGESLREFWTEIPVTLRYFTSKQRLLCCMRSTFLFIYRKRKSIYHPSSLIFDRRSFHYIHSRFRFFFCFGRKKLFPVHVSTLLSSLEICSNRALSGQCVLISGSCPGKVCSGVTGSPLEDSSGVFLQRKYT